MIFSFRISLGKAVFCATYLASIYSRFSWFKLVNIFHVEDTRASGPYGEGVQILQDKCPAKMPHLQMILWGPFPRDSLAVNPQSSFADEAFLQDILSCKLRRNPVHRPAKMDQSKARIST